MSRMLSRAVRLLKIGAVAGVAVGVGRMVLQRRRKPETGESSWPTIAETAAQNGQRMDETAEPSDDGGDSGQPDADGADANDDD